MAGHSKWANIKHTKEAKDAKRGKLFSKLSKEISIASRLSGVDDPDKSPMLRIVVEKAKASNMPNDTIQRAIDKGLGKLQETETVYENTYEAYTSDNIPILIDTETDNPNRTITEIKNVINKSGGKMLTQGSISWQFEEVGIIEIDITGSKEEAILKIFDFEGVLDVVEEKNKIKIKTTKESLKDNSDRIEGALTNIGSVRDVSISKIIKKEYSGQSAESGSLSELLSQLDDIIEVSQIWVGIT